MLGPNLLLVVNTIFVCKCKCNLFTHEASKSSRSSFKGVRVFWVELEFEDVGFCGGRKTEEPGEKPSEQGREPTTNSTHIMTPSPGIEPERYIFKSLLPLSRLFLRTVPLFVTVHMFCPSLCLLMERHFWTGFVFVGKAYFNKGFWNPKTLRWPRIFQR